MLFTGKASYFRYLSLVGFFGLFILLMLWHTLLAPSSRFPIAIMLMSVITPLLLPMTGFLAKNRRSCAWIAYISIAYFIHGSVEAYANNQERLYAVLEILFSLMLFFGCALYLRNANR